MRIVFILGFIGALALWCMPARAAEPCLKTDNPCEPDKLCTFKASLAEKTLIREIYLRNSPITKRDGARRGVRYDGTLYRESIAEARESFPNDTRAEQRIKAAQIFQEKVREEAARTFRLPTCRLDGRVDLTLLPKAGYGGMFTTPACQVFVNYDGGQYEPGGFGANDATCPEFYERDRAHEVIHQKRCQADAGSGAAHRDSIDVTIEEEIGAYDHSVKLTKAYLKLLSFQCSARKNPRGLRNRADAIEKLLAPYQQRSAP